MPIYLLNTILKESLTQIYDEKVGYFEKPGIKTLYLYNSALSA